MRRRRICNWQKISGTAGAIIVLLSIIGVLAFAVHSLVDQEQKQELLHREMDEIEERIDALGELNRENEVLLRMVRELKVENKELQEQVQELQEWIDVWEIDEAGLSKYAPLHPDAIEGFCYAGDPNITASGAQVEIGRTIAAGPSVPFGTMVLVEGYGIFEVADRGGLIHDGRLDMAIESHSEAYGYGIRPKKVAYRGVE